MPPPAKRRRGDVIGPSMIPPGNRSANDVGGYNADMIMRVMVVLTALLCLGVSWLSGLLYLYRARTLLRSSWDASKGSQEPR